MLKRAYIKSVNLIGDGINISQAFRIWQRKHWDYEIDLFVLNDHAKCLYTHMGIHSNIIHNEPEDLSVYDFCFNFDCGGAFTIGERDKVHMAEAYARLLGVEIPSLQPIYIPDEEPEWLSTQPKMILISPFSRSCSSQKGGQPNKMLPWFKWKHVLRYLRSLGYPIRVLGGPEDRTDELDFSEEEYMCGMDLNRIALVMRDKAVLLFTIDNGMAHFAAAQSCPTFELYPACLNIEWAVPYGNPYIVPVQIDPAQVSVSGILTFAKAYIPKLISVRA